MSILDAVVMGAALATGVSPVAAHAATRADIAEAVVACVAATTSAGADDGQLSSSGWEGTDIAMDETDTQPLRVYTRGQGPLLVTGTGRSAGELGCNVLSPFSPSAYDALVTNTTTALGVAPTNRDRKTNQVLWIIGSKAVALSPAGTAARPSVRFTVIQLPGKKK